MRSAEDFNQFYATPDPWGLSKLRFRERVIASFLRPYVSDKSVLELGCGEGQLTRTAFKPARHVVAVDISDVAIQRAQLDAPPNAVFRTADIMDISPEGYDAITAIECLYYLSAAERDVFFERLHREHNGTF